MLSGGTRLPSVTTLLPVSTVYSVSRQETQEQVITIIIMIIIDITIIYYILLSLSGDHFAASDYTGGCLHPLSGVARSGDKTYCDFVNI